MMRSMYSGVAGLKTHQTKMDVIGNNIANVNTVGYKSQSVTFTDVFYQTVQSASGPNAETGRGGVNAKQIGIGSTLGTISTKISAQGGTQTTDNPFDVMINGDEFFIVSDGQTNYFSKAGNFNVDGNGNLVNGSGYTVMGWQANAEGEIQKDRVSALRIMSEDKLSAPPAKTTDVTVSGNINQQDDAFAANQIIDQYIPYTVQFYDSQGYLYNATFHVTKVADQNNGNYYQFNLYNIVDQNGDVVSQSKYDEQNNEYTYLNEGEEARVVFNNTTDTIKSDPNGALQFSVAPGSAFSMTTDGNAPGTGVDDYDGNFTQKMDLETYIKKGVLEDGTTQATVPKALQGHEITVDYSTLTNYGSESTIDSDRGDLKKLGAGKAAGTLSSLSIATDGKIVGSYTNGDIITLGQIAVASFSNAAGLEKLGDNIFAATMNSGSFNGIGQDITANGHSFSTGVLEMSNVDLSNEFTEMITTQRGFQANSRIITTSDTMLEELINLKR